jgi:hypothetical protein
LDFPFYDFSVIYYDFSKLFQGVICPVLESLRGKKFIFIGWGVMCSDPHRLGGEVDFFQEKKGVAIPLYARCSPFQSHDKHFRRSISAFKGLQPSNILAE